MTLLGRTARRRAVSQPAVQPDFAPLPGIPDNGVDWEFTISELAPLIGSSGDKMLDGWRKQRPGAVDGLQGYTHREIFRVKPRDVTPLMNPDVSNWPFPAGTRKSDWSIPKLDDLTGGYPLVLGMHSFVETHGRPPTWMDIREWFIEPHMLSYFVGPAWTLFHSLDESEQPSRTRWMKGIQWRIGNAYLSYLREIDFLSRMIHDHGIPLRTHIVADSVLKIDFWSGRHAVCLWLPNSFRKRKAKPPFEHGSVHDICLSETPGGWTAVSRASDKDLANLADAIRNG